MALRDEKTAVVNLTPCRHSDSCERQRPAVENCVHTKKIGGAKIVLGGFGSRKQEKETEHENGYAVGIDRASGWYIFLCVGGL